MIELLLLYAIAGCCLGVVTGLIPGIHVNTLSMLVLLLVVQGNIYLVAMIIAMSVVHSFVDFIPSVILGAPDDESFLSVLPGHRYLLRGLGFRAVNLTVIGGLFGGVLAIIVSPIFLFFVEGIFEYLKLVIAPLLIFILVLMVLSEYRRKQKLFALAVIILAGLVGIFTLNNALIRNPLFAAVTGFFGVSTLLYSINKNQGMKKQKIRGEKFSFGDSLHGSLLSLVAGGSVSLIPSIGPSQAAFMVGQLVRKLKAEKYLVLLGGINTVNMIFSFFVLYAIGKTRTGPAVVVKQLLFLETEHLLLIAGVILFAILFAVFATRGLAVVLLKRIHLLPYKKINFVVLLFLGVLTFVLSGFMGLVVMGTAASIGLVTLFIGIKRTHCMAFLMVPTILLYLAV